MYLIIYREKGDKTIIDMLSRPELEMLLDSKEFKFTDHPPYDPSAMVEGTAYIVSGEAVKPKVKRTSTWEF